MGEELDGHAPGIAAGGGAAKPASTAGRGRAQRRQTAKAASHDVREPAAAPAIRHSTTRSTWCTTHDFYGLLTTCHPNGGREETELNPRLVIALLGGMSIGLASAILAVAAGWGLLAGFLLYSGIGSSTLLVLTLAWPAPSPALAAAGEPAIA